MRLLSSEFGGRLEQLRLLEALGEQTLRDALTGVGSRRHADALVDGLQPGDSLLLIDVDHFKDVNDTRGHLGGDRLLEQLGAHLRNGLRDRDSVARYGGDEFVVRLHDNDGDSHVIAQRLLDSWIAIGDVPTFSVGIAAHNAGADPQNDVRRRRPRVVREQARGPRPRSRLPELQSQLIRYVDRVEHAARVGLVAFDLHESGPGCALGAPDGEVVVGAGNRGRRISGCACGDRDSTAVGRPVRWSTFRRRVLRGSV